MNFCFFWVSPLSGEQAAAVVKAANGAGAWFIGDSTADTAAFFIGGDRVEAIAAAVKIGKAAGVAGDISYEGNWRMFSCI